MARTGILLAVLALGGLLAVSGLAGTGERGTPVAASFRLADGSVACAYSEATIRCRADGRPAGLQLYADGDSRAARETVRWDRSTPVLLAGESWWNGDISCLGGEREITCSTLSGGRIVVGVEGAGALAPPVSTE